MSTATGKVPSGLARVEWWTVALLLGDYLVLAGALTLLPSVSLWLAVPVAAWAIAQHSSLTHEVIHGHPTPWRRVNAALVFPALTLVIPYLRFRDTHLAHHHDAILTDPYDDPESNYLDPGVWSRLGPLRRAVLRVNNTLLGRLLIGPLVGTAAFVAADLRAIARGERAVIRGWLWHLPAAALTLALVSLTPMPLWAYGLAAYLALSLLKIRTFLEHRAEVHAAERTVVIEDRGPFALLFLNNNLHVVHHMHPRVPWYRLPALYRENPGRYLGRNGGYRYASYAEIFRRYLFNAKDPVPHPLWRAEGEAGPRGQSAP